MSQSVELEDDEIRPELKLSDQEIAALEQERRELTGFAASVRKADSGRIRGEGSAILDTGPVRTIRSIREEESSPALKPQTRDDFDPPWQRAGIRPTHLQKGGTRKLGNVDASVLARLVKAAKDADVLAEEAREFVAHAESEAVETRAALDDYMTECGLR
jgi:chorismate mutase